MSAPVIHTHLLNKIYKGAVEFHALHDINLTIMSGEMIAIMGASGSGKSTLMNIIGCLDRLSSGEYWLRGRSISEYNDNELAFIRNREIGFVFQNFNLLPRYSARKNVELPLLYSAVSNREREQRAIAALERVGLGSKLSNRPNELSGGQKQRVAIARALVNRPAMIMADEPTGALDSRTGVEIMRLFQELNRDGMTLIIVTHEADIAGYCQRVIRMQDGRIIEDTAQTQIQVDAQDAD
ncbi:macrolide ABC transporter ATP-binding protein [bacterium (Candidatus Blackallbacteria) CG17_big_fil_post_rev_8_21_14_2_50_48_46]|uniref:Macrolide ABC transporter ATP-binding protein n=1 Tax=bacterium (Candidatus Blackallbacteria) CG17_big_fil_post_rev_8_21_14_2_50_48_46 TaxID=2014261 RepID=A0A2M7G7V2_9BACT|nr:MAG: macrolide ABC transporter ATP-binding protein [bacterium (Candidatus Blackallbacteria) CG18_big_fil_WC_8_21_14_2_50_49_26]PIW18147.1 MAG: macrolide ABC transporter ATP-binding protein [bacterium (Candidatus Blackallbacteria) CG17_big_fil_post_rev_8_21_14_2_50_48_46]PIW47018.1 MAG: macrolide ABC transporter ATP-binding protein [bacterium (Candidatus Blackallbacteria) CG13_big_fil_rev_8_21_14_2_50_49_14]